MKLLEEKRALSGSVTHQAAGSNASERRRSGRRRALLGGIVTARDGGQTWDCSIRNLSDTGARISVGEGQVIPRDCIVINLRAGIATKATVKWAQPPLFGVQLGDSRRLDDVSNPKLRFLRSLWIERRGRSI
jgi:PilZ domain